MVETPLRRSRRIKSQSDDEASVASSTRSRGSRSSAVRAAASNDDVTSATTPTRRSTRATRAAKGAKSTKKELEAIPETISADGGVVDDNDAVVVVAATPAKSARKKKKKSPAKSPIVTEQGKGDSAESVDADGGGADADAGVAATPAKSGKKNRKKTPAKSPNATEQVKGEDVAESVEAADAIVSETPPKSSKKKKKKTPTKSPIVTEQAKEVTAKPVDADGGGADAGVAATTTPAKSAKKTRKKTPAKSPNATEHSKDDVDADGGVGEADAGVAATTPSKSARKKKKKTPSKSPSVTEQGKGDPTESVEAVGVAGDGVASESPSKTPSKSAKKSKKKKTTTEDDSKQGKLLEAKEEATQPGDSPSTPSPSKSSKKKKKKQATENSPAKASTESTISQPAVPASTKNKKKKKRRRKTSLGSEEEGDSSTDKPSDNDAPILKNKKKKRRKISISSEEKDPSTTKKKDAPSSSEEKPHSKNAHKKLSKTSNPEDDKEEPMDTTASTSAAVPLSKSSRKKKRVVTAVDDSSKKKKASKKSKVGDKSPTKKKQTSPHKKQQPYKHDRPTSSPNPKAKPTKLNMSPKQDVAKSIQPTESPKPVMDVKVHRLRFLKLHPKSILAMASTTPLEEPSSAAGGGPRAPVRLAISREGGSVELLSPQDRWVNVGDVPGVRGREVDALVWVCGKQGNVDNKDGSGFDAVALASEQSHRVRLVDERRRLFGCSRDGTIFELDFATKRQKGVIGSGGGGVFCLASMCSRGQCCCSQGGGNNDRSCRGYIAAGCEDGTIKIYSALGSDGGETVSGMPQLVATLPSAGNAILSLAWVPGRSSRNDDGGMGGSVIFAGVADGTIRRFDCTTSITTGPISTGTVLASSRGSASISYRWKSTLRMTVENRGLRESTKVWALQALSDGTVISGDSLGHVQMWDGLSGTMSQTFDHNESGADVLCLAVSEDENKIFASGIDSSVRCFERQCSPTAADMDRRSITFESAPLRKWISSISHRKHSHDVKALAMCHKETGNSAKPLELLVSGSVDTRICTYVAKDYKSSRPKIWYNWPTLSPISVSRKQRLLAVTRDNRVDLYRLNSPEMANPLKNMNPETKDDTKCLVKTISIQSPFNLSCSAISDDGKFLAASDAVSLYLFLLEVEDDDGMMDVHPTKLSLPGACKHPATAMRFDDRGRLICATNNGPINILQMSPLSETDASDGSSYKVSLEHVFKEHLVDWSATSHHFPVVCLDLSSDGKWLAAGRFSSGKGAVHVFTLPTNEEGRYQHWWSVPKMDSPTTCIKFLGGRSDESSLAVGCSNNEFYIYNLGRRSLSHWSNDMGLPLLKSLPKELTSRSEPVTRIVSNPITPQRFILGSHGYFCVVDLDQPVPEKARMFPSDHLRAKRLQLIKEDDTTMYGPLRQKKSKSNSVRDSGTNFTICLRYCEMLFQDFVAENEMVIVEEPWMSILEELPDALARRVYGT